MITNPNEGPPLVFSVLLLVEISTVSCQFFEISSSSEISLKFLKFSEFPLSHISYNNW